MLEERAASASAPLPAGNRSRGGDALVEPKEKEKRSKPESRGRLFDRMTGVAVAPAHMPGMKLHGVPVTKVGNGAEAPSISKPVSKNGLRAFAVNGSVRASFEIV